MSSEKVTGSRGETIGLMESLGSERIKGTDKHGRIVGYYDSRADKTLLPNGNVYSRGNDLRELIRANA